MVTYRNPIGKDLSAISLAGQLGISGNGDKPAPFYCDIPCVHLNELLATIYEIVNKGFNYVGVYSTSNQEHIPKITSQITEGFSLDTTATNEVEDKKIGLTNRGFEVIVLPHFYGPCQAVTDSVLVYARPNGKNNPD